MTNAEIIPTRRITTVRLATLLTVIIITVSSTGARQAVPRSRLRIGLITPSVESASAASVARGVRLGAAEAQQTAKLFGDDVELYEASASADAGAVAAATRLSSSRQVHVLIGTSANDADALSRFAESRGILFFNVASRASALRAACRRHTFHLEVASTGNGSDTLLLWNPTLERFGAAQINDRYRRKYGIPMDGQAWAGWAAAKIASEAALRAHSTNPAKLLAYLESPEGRFDGHKGIPLTFGAADHQLRQPLYSRDANEIQDRASDSPPATCRSSKR
jgi:ABC-type branched-subunit amino acid transport system substrate-binding protein